MIRKNHGFTLVELAIVMVIMGLLVFGAVAGRALLRASQLKALTSEIESYKMAVDNFSLQYGGLPGDLKNAESFWTNDRVSNGNNNSKIDTNGESFQAWLHLSLAQMISGTYSGGGINIVLGDNIPASRYGQAGYDLLWVDDPGEWRDNQGRSYAGNYAMYGAKGTQSEESRLVKSSLIPEDAYSIDNKLDNGYPGSGVVLAIAGEENKVCFNGNEYNAALSELACVLYIRIN